MKTKIGRANLLYPAVTVLVGSLVDGKPTFTTITHVGIMDLQTVSISVRKEHYINNGLQQHNTYSVNIPSVDLVREVDLCGHISGRDFDKSANFEIFYGSMKTAPMIRQCQVNMECIITHTIDLPSYIVYVGKINATFCDNDLLINKKVNMEKLQPILFSMQDYGYWSINKRFADTGFPFRQIVDKYLEEEFEKVAKEG